MRKHLIALVALAALASAPMYGQADQQLVIDDNAGNVATFEVVAGVPLLVSCLGNCAGLVPTYTPGTFDPLHGQLNVSGSIGQFTVNITGQGGGFVVSPTNQNLNEIDAASTGAGTLNVLFTDTDYTEFGNPFFLSASGTYSAPVTGSSTDFTALMDPGNGIPAGTTIGSINNLECVSAGGPCSFAQTVMFVNPTGSTSGSLTTAKEITFSGAGEILLNLSISSIPAQVPEPGSVVLLGTMLLGTGLTLRRRFGKRV